MMSRFARDRLVTLVMLALVVAQPLLLATVRMAHAEHRTSQSLSVRADVDATRLSADARTRSCATKACFDAVIAETERGVTLQATGIRYSAGKVWAVDGWPPHATTPPPRALTS